MTKNKDALGKQKKHNQYGEIHKDESEKSRDQELPKPPNKGTQKKK